MLQCIKHSFAAKLNFYILLSLFLFGGIGFGIFHYYASRTIEKQTYIRLDETTEKINLKISRLLRTIEKIPENLSWIIPSYVTHPDSVFSITRQVVETNPEIFGCAIAFEPNYFPEKGKYFSPYSYMSGDSVITTQIPEKYNYYGKNWYRITKELNTSRWSIPYHELSAQDILTTTYAVPLHDPQKKVIGIFSVDLSITWITSLIDSVTLFEDSYSIILNKDGKYILPPRSTGFPGQENPVFAIASDSYDTLASNIIRHMLQKEKGHDIFYNKGTQYYIYYTPIEDTEWVMATIFPYSHIFAGLHHVNRILILIFLLSMGLIILINTVTIRKITHPLKIFATSAQAIAHGNFNTPLPPLRTSDEMLELHKAFNEMQTKLSDYMHNLETTTAAKEKIESELRIAHDIQMSMLPKTYPPFPGRKEVDLHAVLYPARQVGGDFYDYFISDNCLYFAIGDVSGKGIPASLLMASTVSLMRSFITDYSSPAQMACFLNNSIAERNDADMFVTFFIGKLELHSGYLKYCNAGHNPPILTHPDKSVSFFPLDNDIPLGIVKDYAYKEYSYLFRNGSGLLLYTDGVTDAENKEGKFYTKERLLQTICRSHHLHPQEFLEAILTDIHKHVQNHALSDDLSMLTFIYGTQWDIKNS